MFSVLAERIPYT